MCSRGRSNIRFSHLSRDNFDSHSIHIEHHQFLFVSRVLRMTYTCTNIVRCLRYTLSRQILNIPRPCFFIFYLSSSPPPAAAPLARTSWHFFRFNINEKCIYCVWYYSNSELNWNQFFSYPRLFIFFISIRLWWQAIRRKAAREMKWRLWIDLFIMRYFGRAISCIRNCEWWLLDIRWKPASAHRFAPFIIHHEVRSLVCYWVFRLLVWRPQCIVNANAMYRLLRNTIDVRAVRQSTIDVSMRYT